ncbi:hypothetical protein CLU88_2591 [Acidovorax sp. 56]|nr:hypothetical protein CLU88_2591 [Acidovorax sp. 56]
MALRYSWLRNLIATVALVPLLILWIALSNDALSEFNRPGDGWILSALYFGLVAMSVFLYYKLVSRRHSGQPHPKAADGGA